jgi:hypothetical protein
MLSLASVLEILGMKFMMFELESSVRGEDDWRGLNYVGGTILLARRRCSASKWRLRMLKSCKKI